MKEKPTGVSGNPLQTPNKKDTFIGAFFIW